MSNRDPDSRYEDLSQALDFVWWQQAKALHTAIMGLVTGYDPATKRARVQPAVRILKTDGSTMDRPLILNVPVKQTATGGWMIHQEIAEGDVVLVVFNERGIDRFKTAWGELADPTVDALFSERDAVAIPWGVETVAPAATTGVVIQNEDASTVVSIQGDKVVIQVDSGERVYIGGESDAQQLATREFVERHFNTHVHPSPSGPTGPPTYPAPLTAGDDITDKTRAE